VRPLPQRSAECARFVRWLSTHAAVERVSKPPCSPVLRIKTRNAGWAGFHLRADGAPTPADAEWADGIIFGTPTRFGNTSAELKAFIDSLGGLWFQGKLNGKAAGAFTSTAGPHGGNETTVVSLYIPMAHLGFIIVPNGYTHEKVFQGHGTPYGSSSISGQNTAPPTADELVVAKHQGARMTQVAAALKASR
jgi:NAD(P)H dehydrogenase (quinone)